MDLQDVLDVGEEDLEWTKRPASVRSTEQGHSQNSCIPTCNEQALEGEAPLGQAAAAGYDLLLHTAGVQASGRSGLDCHTHW